jgi:hypothetical protein
MEMASRSCLGRTLGAALVNAVPLRDEIPDIARTPLYGCAVSLPRPGPLRAGCSQGADPKHYTVVSENDQVRILRAHYGPHEKSVMHSDPATVAVFLSDQTGKASSTSPTARHRSSAARQGTRLGFFFP